MDAPAAAVSRDGKRFAIAWMDASGDKGNRDVSWTLAGAAAARAHDDGKSQQGHPAIAADPTGTFHLVWEDSRSGASRIYYRTSLPKAKEEAISSDGATQPVIAAGGKQVAAAWEQNGDVMFKLLR